MAPRRARNAITFFIVCIERRVPGVKSISLALLSVCFCFGLVDRPLSCGRWRRTKANRLPLITQGQLGVTPTACLFGACY